MAQEVCKLTHQTSDIRLTEKSASSDCLESSGGEIPGFGGKKHGRCRPKIPIVLAISLVMFIAAWVVEGPEDRPLAWKGAAVLFITALWWVTEIVPLVVTSFLPMVLYPLMGIVNASALAKNFVNGTSFLFCAGFLLASAVERWGLHHRVAFNIAASSAASIELLVGGFMLSVWLLSMWISNTATILTMLPVARAFLASLPDGSGRFESGFLLAMGYSATIGGIATPVGTPTNGIFLGMFQSMWPEEEEFSFFTFMQCALPLSFILLLFTWLGVCTGYVWVAQARPSVDRAVIRAEVTKLGKWTFEEMVVAVDIALLVALWLTAAPTGDFEGWEKSVAPELNSGSIGLALLLPLFFVPCGARLPASARRCLGADRCKSEKAADDSPQHILDWDVVKSGFQWEVVFVFGGGFMIAEGSNTSGLADMIAEALAEVDVGGELGFMLVCTLVTCFMTEFVSNMATAQIFGPIVVATAEKKGYNQVLFLLAVALAASFAFMLPMAGGPNMTVYATGKIPLRFMATNGFLLNIFAVLVGSVYLSFAASDFLASFKGISPALN